MKKFIYQIMVFLVVFIALPLIILILLPATPRSEKSLLFSQIDKDSLLSITPEPRIIFLGGSNVSFGLISQIIKDSLSINPINTGIHANVGLQYILNHNEQYIRKADIVILSPEYEQFFGNTAFGSEELLRIVLDVSNPDELSRMTFDQIRSTYPFLIKYAFSKVKISEYQEIGDTLIYSRSSFNEYGDAFSHWGMGYGIIEPSPQIIEKFNPKAVKLIVEFEKRLKLKGAKFFVMLPVLQAKSFDILSKSIFQVEDSLEKAGFVLLGQAEDWRLEDTLFFNTPYHLTRRGSELRTKLVIDCLKTVIDGK